MSKASILISSYNRLPLLRRTLYAIATRGPSGRFEVVLADDGSTDDILSELRLYNSVFPWKFVKVNAAKFEEATGLKKFLNNPAWTNNVAFRHADPSSEFIFTQGNEVIAVADCYDRLLADYRALGTEFGMVMSTTYDVPQAQLDRLDTYGDNLTARLVKECERWPLQSKAYRSDVTNYVSLTSRQLWHDIGGYDERYFGGISSDDSDFVRRARCLFYCKTVVSDAVSLHQYHQGKTTYYDPPTSVISRERWDEGVAINHKIYHAWDGNAHNPQPWPWGEYGVEEVIANK